MSERNQTADRRVAGGVQRSRRVLLGAGALGLSALVVGAVVSACKLETRSPSLAEKAVAPEFSLPSHQGTRVALSELLRNGPAVVIFYRGHW